MSQSEFKFDSSKVDWNKCDGMVPAIIQHCESGNVLMLGYMTADSLSQTLESGRVTFFSRSRQELWTKGETSGNFLDLKGVAVDCDGDTLLIQASPTGPVCHQGTSTCFGDVSNDGFLSTLESIIESRRASDAQDSYTAKLLQGPIQKVAQKVGEEGVEVALAAVNQSDEDLLDESADLIYHLLVLLAHRNLKLSDVESVLQARHAD